MFNLCLLELFWRTVKHADMIDRSVQISAWTVQLIPLGTSYGFIQRSVFFLKMTELFHCISG